MKPLLEQVKRNTKCITKLQCQIDDIELTPGPAGADGATPWILPATVYDNGLSYGIGAAVTYEGGYYYRTGNPLNPGYPPTPGSINASWTPVADGGLTGLTGQQGEQGIPGTDGAVGPAGLEWQGLWDTDTAYLADDAVSFGGASWFCINPITSTGNLDPSLDTGNWALLAAQGAQGLQGIQGPVGPSGVVVLTSEVLVGGPFNSPVVLTTDVTALNPTNNSSTASFRLPNMAGVANAVGKEFLVHNISENYTAQIRITSGIYATIRQNLSSNLNGYTPQTNTINLSRGRTARFIFLGTLVPWVGANPTQTWSLELLETTRPKTNSSLISITSTYASINNDVNRFLPTSATFNNVSFPVNPLDNKFLVGDSIIIANYSDTYNLNIVGGNILQYEMNSIGSSVPYVIAPKGIVRATLADSYYWVVEVITY